MMPIGVLMNEHRLIERMLEVVENEVGKARTRNCIEPVFIDTTIDFIRTYADKTHHGKEESILFRDAAKKEMTPEDRAILQDLLDDHNFGRKRVGELAEAKQRYREEGDGFLEAVLEKLDTLVDFYRKHIRKEDDVFFPTSTAYFSKEEQDAMLQEFWESDRKMIHEKYRSVVEILEAAEGGACVR